MRAAYEVMYSIFLSFSPGLLIFFEAKATEPYVDWFGFMAYDLQGF